MQPTLDRLYQFYRYDLSEYNHQDVGPDGEFPHEGLTRYVTDPHFHSCFITLDGRLAGFALVNLRSHTYEGEWVRNLDDFFVLRSCRRRGVGARAAHSLFRGIPGLWQINKRTYNEAAMKFWDRVVRKFTGGDHTEHIVQSNIHIHIFRSLDRSAS